MASLVAELDKLKDTYSSYDLAQTPLPQPAPLPENKMPTIGGDSLATAIDAYLSENKKTGTWVGRTFTKKAATLQCLIELLGADLPALALSKKHAQDVKAVLIDLPANKNKNPLTRDLSLREATKVQGVERISPETINGYISIFQSFNDWAVKNGYAKANVFSGMKVSKKRAAAAASPARTAFTPDAIQAMLTELTSPHSRIVKKDSYRWASMLGIFTGARLNEICSLRTSDIIEQDEIWCLSINDDDPQNRKSLKSAAARRLIPLHSKLLASGFRQFAASRRRGTSEQQLFPEFPYSEKHGFGRNQGRWFNEAFLPGLGLKTDQLVFHSLRHTVVTRLHQAGVAQPLVQTLIGHEREGVTQATYFTEGYTVNQLIEAIEKLH